MRKMNLPKSTTKALTERIRSVYWYGLCELYKDPFVDMMSMPYQLPREPVDKLIEKLFNKNIYVLGMVNLAM